jgi:hypothetical protein
MTTCEVVALPVIVAAFVITGLYCIRIRVVAQNSNELSLIEMNPIIKSINEVAITLSLVFATLLIRSTYSFIQAYASFTSAIVQTPDCIAFGALS